MRKDKVILDACCGGRMMWIDKENPNVLFMDIRKEAKGFIKEQPNFEICPDVIGDYRKTEFKDSQFIHIVWDIPHMIKGSSGIITKKYFFLGDNWKEDLTQGFNELWRILADGGTLCLKFSDLDIAIKDLLVLFPEKPLYGTPTKKGVNNTYWFVFVKLDSLQEEEEDEQTEQEYRIAG
jgi:hypothetical protein